MMKEPELTGNLSKAWEKASSSDSQTEEAPEPQNFQDRIRSTMDKLKDSSEKMSVIYFYFSG